MKSAIRNPQSAIRNSLDERPADDLEDANLLCLMLAAVLILCILGWDWLADRVRRLWRWLNWRVQCSWCGRHICGNRLAYAVTHGVCPACANQWQATIAEYCPDQSHSPS